MLIFIRENALSFDERKIFMNEMDVHQRLLDVILNIKIIIEYILEFNRRFTYKK